MAYQTSNEYKQIIYSQGSIHKLRIWFDDIELEEADNYCEKITLKNRIIPESNSSRFCLSNFVSKEITAIFHDLDLDKIKGKCKISIGTLVGEEYEYVPIGIFNIQNAPTTDQNKITIQLRDNSTLFDFNYNAKPLIDGNGGKATKLQILKDICMQAGVVCNIEEFIGSINEVSIYDNTIKGRTYIYYLAEQSGAIPTIDRNGELIFIYLNNLNVVRIPLSIVEKYEVGDTYKITRVVYEDGIRKYESIAKEDSTNDDLFLDSANPYISSQEQIDEIASIVNNFEIKSVTTGKILGDPAIDCYDIIEVYDDYVEEEPVIFRTLANYELIYNGVFINTYTTQIGLEAKKENVSLNSGPTFRKYAKTNIDNINNNIELIVAEQDEQQSKITQMTIDINSIKNLFQITGGINLIKNSVGFFGKNYWEESENGTFSYGEDRTLLGTTISSSKITIQNGTLKSSNNNITGITLDTIKSLSYKIKQDEDVTTTITLYGLAKNQPLYQKTLTGKYDWQEIYDENENKLYADNSELTLEITSTSTYNGTFSISDLMLNEGEKQAWQPANGEVWGTVIKMSQQGISCYSIEGGYITIMNTQGVQVRELHGDSIGEIITDFTNLGINTNEITQTGKYTQRKLVHDYINYNNYETYVEYIKE